MGSSHADRRGLSARAMSAGGVLVGACALALSGCTSSSVMNLSVGDCMQLPTDSTAVTIDRSSCTSPHQAEVAAVIDVQSDADAAFPGKAALNSQAETACVESFEDYVGAAYVSSSLDVTWLTPTAESWQRGDRSIVCLVHAMGSAELTASVKGSGL